jgi:hypothetical protein
MILLLFLFCCFLTLVLAVARYLLCSRQQDISFDYRCQQALLEFHHQQNLPRPVVRCFYGPDVPVPYLAKERLPEQQPFDFYPVLES